MERGSLFADILNLELQAANVAVGVVLAKAHTKRWAGKQPLQSLPDEIQDVTRHVGRHLTVGDEPRLTATDWSGSERRKRSSVGLHRFVIRFHNKLYYSFYLRCEYDALVAKLNQSTF